MGKTKAKVWAWDIEADNWDQVRCVCAISSDGDAERFYGPDSLERMAEVMEKAGGNWIAHAGGIYDTLLLLGARSKPFIELIMSGSAILCAKDGGLRVRDSFRWWLAGLADVGKFLDKEDGDTGRWLKQSVDRKRIASLTQAEVQSYCESDCRILLRGVERCSGYLEEQGARPAWTSGASALNLLQRIEPAGWSLLQRFRLDFDTARTARECVRGARTESWALGRVPQLWPYDFKSAYPAAYAFDVLPMGAKHLAAGDRDVPGSIWRCRWFWPWRHKLPPVTDAATGGGAGWCEAWCCPEEREDLDAAGVAVQLLEGWAPECMAPIGQVFVREMFKQKDAGSPWAKVFGNSLHGKFSENPVRENYRSDRKPDTWYGPEPKLLGDYWHSFSTAEDNLGNVPRHVQPLAAATILGRARSKLYRALSAIIAGGGRIFYSDTDSIHCSLPPDRVAAIGKSTGAFSVGKKLGQLNPEGGPFEGIYLGAKAYALIDTTTGEAVKGALKGVPWKSLVDGVREDVDGIPLFRQARDDEAGTDLRRDLFEEVLRSGKVLARKEGIRTFVSGLNRSARHLDDRAAGVVRPALADDVAPWKKAVVLRTIQASTRNKRIENGTTWAYRTPVEVVQARTGAELRGATTAGRTFLRQLSTAALFREGVALVEASGTTPQTLPPTHPTSPLWVPLEEINEHLGARGARRCPTPESCWRRLAQRNQTGIDTPADLRARALALDDAALWMRTIPGWEAFSVADSTTKLVVQAREIDAAADALAGARTAQGALYAPEQVDDDGAPASEDEVDTWG